MIRVAFNVLIADDKILEKHENFILAIDQSSLPSGVAVGNRNQARVIIMDDDSKCQLLSINLPMHH